jgi:serine protease Do
MTPAQTVIEKYVSTVFAIALALCCDIASAQPAPQQQSAATAAVPAVLPNFVPLVKQQGPAVVNISSTRTVTQDPDAQLQQGDPLSEFFRRFMPPPGNGQFEEQSLGSGFIIDPAGYILTNGHVVADADEVTVKLTTKREYKAKVIGTDPYTDVALLKINATGLPVVRLGDPSRLEVGEWVAAIGAPFGFENSVTAGIVSAKGRSLPDESYVPFIQTDVAVNPGNSGGPLFSMRGDVIGINSLIYSRTGGFMGLSFAIPIDIALDVAKQLRATGKVTRGRIGVQAQEMTIELAASFGLKEPHGALVAMVEKNGPAAKAGIQPGDVILGINGRPVEDSADLARYVAGSKPGTTVTVDVWRKGGHLPVQVTLGELAAKPSATSEAEKNAPDAAGLALGELTPEQRKRLDVPSGVLVRGAVGAAQRAGVQPGDIIISVNRQPVNSIDDLEAKLAQHPGKTVALLLKREDATLFLPLKLPAKGEQNSG